jgi:tRNA A-37 threonylcarbamoyl transferase component Bud32
MPERETICPGCEAAGGELGAACTNPVCGKMGYHFIPARSFLRNRSKASSSGARPDPSVGRLVDRYLVLEKLGEGGMGAVYLALQLPVKKEVALKMIAGLQLDDDARKRFEREATAISRLYHPNIVSLVDYGMDPQTGAPYMAIEYVRGGRELADVMETRRLAGRTWSAEELISIFTQVLNGLAVAHREGLVHRDIKPQNIMLVAVEGNPHFVYLLDFGLAKALEDIPGFETLTAGGAVIGTPQYMAPEQIASRGDVDFRCDLYAVGAVFFEMITGRSCCSGNSTKEILFEKLNPDFDPLGTLPPGSLDPAMASFLKRATAREPSERFESAGVMRRALVETLGGRIEAGEGGDEDAAAGPTVAVDSRKLLDEAGGPRGAAGVTQDVRSVPGAAGTRGRVSSGRWMLLAGALGLAAAAAIAFFLGPWSPFSREGDEPTAEKQAAQAPVPEPESPEPEPATPEKEPVEPVQESGAAEEPAQVHEPGPRDKVVKKQKKLPAQPSDEEIDRERKKLEKSLMACAEGLSGSLKGTVYLRGKTGKSNSYFMQGKLNTNETRKCLGAAINAVQVEPFSEVKAQFNFSIAIDQAAQEPAQPATPPENQEMQTQQPVPAPQTPPGL